MCIAAWIWQDHPVYQLLLVLNRDEYYSRPTQPADWWGEGDEKILGGRDELAGGTWLGCTRNGRLAFITNFREPKPNPPREERVGGESSPQEYAEEIAKEADQYDGFNLILTDFNSKAMVYVSNRPKEEPPTVHVVSPGVHVLSNAKLDTPWPKAIWLCKHFQEEIHKHNRKDIPLKDIMEKLMKDTTKAGRLSLPNTGVDPDWEFQLSSIFIEVDSELGKYGTRSQTALSVKQNGEANFYEKYLENGTWKEHYFQYHTKTITSL